MNIEEQLQEARRLINRSKMDLLRLHRKINVINPVGDEKLDNAIREKAEKLDQADNLLLEIILADESTESAPGQPPQILSPNPSAEPIPPRPPPSNQP